MALEITVTGDNGLDISYWKIGDLSNNFIGDKIDLRFTLNGYKDADWRAKDANAKSLVFHQLLPIGLEYRVHVLLRLDKNPHR